MNETEMLQVCATFIGGTYEGLTAEHPFTIEAPCHKLLSPDGDICYVFLFNGTAVIPAPSPMGGDGWLIIGLPLSSDTFAPSTAMVGSTEAASQMLRDMAYAS